MPEGEAAARSVESQTPSDPWESRYRGLEEAALALREERDQLRSDLDTLRDYFKNTWNIDNIIERGRKR